MGSMSAGYPMQIVATDLVGPLPESESGNRYILVVADYFTRWVEAFPLPNQEAETVATKLVDEVFLRFSIPEQLHSDQGRQFESHLIKEICKLLRVNKTRTTPYHPQGDGLVERFNRTLLNMLAICAKDHPFEWEYHIRKVCMAYNSSVHSSTGYTPFYLMFGRQARLPVDIMYSTREQVPKPHGEYARDLQVRLQSAFDLVRENVSKEQQRQKDFYDIKIHGNPFQKEDLVWLHTPAVKKGASRKLHHPWSGPFKVIKKISESTYRIQQLYGNRHRKVVHFDRLKPCSAAPLANANSNRPAQEHQTGNEIHVTAQPPVIGNNLQLIDDDDDDSFGQSPRTTAPVIEPEPQRYPTRTHHPPARFGDFIRY